MMEKTVEKNAADTTHRARPIMVLGTMSNAGKSFVAAGLCRVFVQDGYRVAPFKAQNMALNSFITKDGLEMGRSQVVQAEACRKDPDARMNPILLKPTTDKGSQIIVMGKPVGNMEAKEYYRHKDAYIPSVMEAFDSLSEENDIIVLEGAGSPAEINLKNEDIVNMRMAALAKAPVLLVGNIDPGGVFAQLYGTVKLLDEDEQELIAGLIINKFRGDISILEPGLKMLEERAGKPVLGVLPYMDVMLEPEDSLAIEDWEKQTEALRKSMSSLDVAVIRLPKISNFTDVDALRMEPDINLRYVSNARELGTPDLIILPGTKSTIEDMLWLRQSGLETMINRALKKGSFLVGICGGYQMLGKKIVDPTGAEREGEIDAMGLLDMVTVFEEEKMMQQTTWTSNFGIPQIDGRKVVGYEVHMGRSVSEDAAEAAGSDAYVVASADKDAAEKGIIGTYIHGVFDEEDFREAFINYLYERKGETRGEATGGAPMSYKEFKEQQYDHLADILREHLDIPGLYRMMGLPEVPPAKR